MKPFKELYKSLISEYNEDYKDPHADAEQEYRGYTISYKTEYQEDYSHNFYTIFTPDGKEISSVDLQNIGVKLPRDDNEAFDVIAGLIDTGKI
tara:strand:+ start:594 stop:872 length:279 start_codon:yes stop_codon:yes gene_type:complete